MVAWTKDQLQSVLEVKGADGEMKYSYGVRKAVRQAVSDKPEEFLTLEDVAPELERLQKLLDNPPYSKDKFWGQLNVTTYRYDVRGYKITAVYSKAVRDHFTKLAKDSWIQIIDNYRTLDEVKIELNRLKAVFNNKPYTRADFRDLLMRTETVFADRYGPIYSPEVRKHFNKKYSFMETLEKFDELEPAAGGEGLETDEPNSVKQELDRLQNVFEKRFDLQYLLANESYSKVVRKSYNERHDWKGELDAKREKFFTDFIEDQAREELNQLQATYDETFSLEEQSNSWLLNQDYSLIVKKMFINSFDVDLYRIQDDPDYLDSVKLEVVEINKSFKNAKAWKRKLMETIEEWSMASEDAKAEIGKDGKGMFSFNSFNSQELFEDAGVWGAIEAFDKGGASEYKLRALIGEDGQTIMNEIDAAFAELTAAVDVFEDCVKGKVSEWTADTQLTDNTCFDAFEGTVTDALAEYLTSGDVVAPM